MPMANEQYLVSTSAKQLNSHKWKTWQLGFQTLERYWASFQVTRLFHNATIFFNQADYYNEEFFIFFSGRGLSSNVFTIWCCIPISRPPRVIRRFKRRSCFSLCKLSSRNHLSSPKSSSTHSLVAINTWLTPGILTRSHSSLDLHPTLCATRAPIRPPYKYRLNF